MKSTIRYICFEMTRQCNLSCLYCYNHWRRDDTAIEAPTLTTITRTLKQLNRRVDFEHITLTGGEPLLTGDALFEAILYCRMRRKSVNVLSNGTVGSEHDYALMHKMGVSLFQFPLLSPTAEVHDKLAGFPGAFDRVMTSVASLQAHGADLCLVFVLTRMNALLFTDTLLLARQLGIRRMMLARFNIGGRGIGNTEVLLPSLEELRGAFREANAFARNGRMRITSNVCVPHCVIDPRDYPNMAISSCAPDARRRPITVDFDGNVRMCNHSPVVMGNIHNDNVDAILDSPYARTWQTAQPEFCRPCERWEACRGGCRAASEQVGLSVAAEDPVVHMVNRSRFTRAHMS